MEWIVTTGKTVAEAVEAALDELGVDEADIEYEVIEESKRGFLSRLGGGSPARIKARVKPVSREKPDRRRRSGGRDRDRERKGDGGERATRARPDRTSADRSDFDRQNADRSGADRAGSERPGAGRPGRSRSAAAVGDAGEALGEEPDEQSVPDRAAGARGGERGPSGSASRNRRRRKPSGTSAARATTPETSSNGDDEEGAVSGSEVSLEERAELAEAFARGLIERFGQTATVSARAEG